MVDNGHPYVIPLSFAYELEDDKLALYFHSAKEGRKLDILHKNSEVCFEMSMEGTPIFAEKTPCNSGYYFSSVHGFGNVKFIDSVQEKCSALSLLMKHQGNITVEFTDSQAKSVCLYKVVASELLGKENCVQWIKRVFT